MTDLDKLLHAAEAAARFANTHADCSEAEENSAWVLRLTAALRLAICQRDYWVSDETPLMDKYNAQLETILKGGARGE